MRRIKIIKNIHIYNFIAILAFYAVGTFAAEPLKTVEEDKVALTETHAISIHGEPRYSADFKHFDFANPNAPKGGTITIGVVGSFDSLNPFILKGLPADGISTNVVESLTTPSLEEPGVAYGVLAEKIVFPEDRSFVEFHLHPKATFQNGTPVLAEDIIFSFETLLKEGHPHYRAYYKAVEKVEKTGDRAVKFHIAPEYASREMPLILGELPILSADYYQENTFNKTTLKQPMGSGPYKVASVDVGNRLILERRDDYWGKDMAVNAGRFNAQKLILDYYRDATVALEAFKAGSFDFREENIARQWATSYDFPAIKDGRAIIEEIPHKNSSGMQGFVYNLRKPLFQDIRVREALMLAYDFQYANSTLFFNMYNRTDSYFDNSSLASFGIPEGAELAVLKPYVDQLPPELFTHPFTLPEHNDRKATRNYLRQAKKLLAEAGWTIQDGVLKNAAGQPFEFEILLVMPTFERVVIPYLQTLEKLGIKATMRTVDIPQYKQRVDNFQFDMTTTVIPQSQSPGNEQRAYWHSQTVDIPGTRNLMGIKSPVVDALVEKIIAAHTREELETATKALDRVLLWNHYVIPHWHSQYFRLAYWSKLQRPQNTPIYSYAFPDYWWVEPKEALQ